MAHKLLLADDSVTIQRVIELTFADEDVHVSVVGNGKQAIEKIEAERPDIVLADIGMPERDGYDVAAFVKGTPQLAHIPVILLTGAFEPLDDTRARQVGCDGVLVKPFEPQTVINRVRELLAAPRTAVARPAAPAPQPAAAVAHAAAPQARTPFEIDSDLAPASAEPARAGGDSLEDYFDRLDAAFANLGAAPPKPVFVPDDLGAGLAELAEPPPERTPASGGDAMAGWDPEIVGDMVPARQPDLANAFAALLAAEEGAPLPAATAAPAPAVRSPLPAPAPAPAAITEETIEEIVTRVIARMGDDGMRRLVVETAERVVREEIERIKRG